MSKTRPDAQQPVVARKRIDLSLVRKTTPKPSSRQPETVEQFLARGGQIERLPAGQRSREEEE